MIIASANKVTISCSVHFFLSVSNDRFRFHCCHINGYLKHSCHHTLYQNDWDKELKYYVPNGYYLSGVESYHHNHYE